MKKQFSLECIICPGIWHIQWTIGHIQITANCTTSDVVPFSSFCVTLFATWEKRNGKWFLIDSYRYQKPSQKKSSTLLMFVLRSLRYRGGEFELFEFFLWLVDSSRVDSKAEVRGSLKVIFDSLSSYLLAGCTSSALVGWGRPAQAPGFAEGIHT